MLGPERNKGDFPYNKEVSRRVSSVTLCTVAVSTRATMNATRFSSGALVGERWALLLLRQHTWTPEHVLPVLAQC